MSNHYINEIISKIDNHKLNILNSSIQHGNTSVLEHSINVAKTSCLIAYKMRLKVNKKSLIKGALLHDYFLYDWHEKRDSKWHGFTHPQTALINAKADFNLNQIEENIILRHMFPLTPIPPKYKEAWLICLSDKYCSLQEMFQEILARKNI